MSRKSAGPVLGAAPLQEADVAVEDLDFGVEPDVEPVVEKPAPTKAVEKFFRVKIDQKTRDDDEDRVPCSVNGEMLYLRRGESIVLPERYIRCLDDALIPIYSGRSGSDGRQQIGLQRRVGYTLLGEATEEDFKELRRKGVLALREYERMLPKENR